MIVYLISCGSKKLPVRARARDFYCGSFFRQQLRYAESRADVVYVLSAKLGLLKLDAWVDPYDLKLNETTEKQRKAWRERVLRALLTLHDRRRDRFFALAGEAYIPRVPWIVDVYRTADPPLKDQRICFRTKFLKAHAPKLKGLHRP